MELGRLVQASSSKPLATGAAELALGGAETALIGDETRLIDGLSRLVICSDAVVIDWRSTVAGGVLLLGCGLPLRVLFFSTPPGPEKRPGAAV